MNSYWDLVFLLNIVSSLMIMEDLTAVGIAVKCIALRLVFFFFFCGLLACGFFLSIQLPSPLGLHVLISQESHEGQNIRNKFDIKRTGRNAIGIEND